MQIRCPRLVPSVPYADCKLFEHCSSVFNPSSRIQSKHQVRQRIPKTCITDHEPEDVEYCGVSGRVVAKNPIPTRQAQGGKDMCYPLEIGKEQGAPASFTRFLLVSSDRSEILQLRLVIQVLSPNSIFASRVNRPPHAQKRRWLALWVCCP